ncbi:MAG: GNAT family N-acetyltransferase [Alphaproteobacteria bacterium]
MNKLKICVSHQPDETLVSELRENLRSYNFAAAGEYALDPFLITHRSEKNALMGGVFAYLRFQWLIIDLLWVHEDYRRRGLGAQLLQKAEEIALSYGVNRFRLNTASFQKGLSLYQTQGYEIFAELPSANVVDGKLVPFTDYYLKKEVS